MLNIAVKHVPAGAVTPAAAKNNIDQMAMKNTQNMAQMQQLRAGASQPGQGAPPPAQMPKAA